MQRERRGIGSDAGQDNAAVSSAVRKLWTARVYAALAGACAGAILFEANPSRAQAFGLFTNPSVPGYDQDRGIEIFQRPRTEYDALGVRVGDVVIRPSFDESIAYDSNVLGIRPSVGSWFTTSSPALAVNSDFGRNSFGANLRLENSQYLDQKQQSKTDFNGSTGATFDLGQDKLTVSAAELYQHLTPVDLDSGNINKPFGYHVTDLRARYETALLRWHFEPNVEYIGYRFDDKLLPASTIDEKVHNRDVVVAGLTTRFGYYTERSLMVVTRAINSQYVADLGGIARPNSLGYEALVGVNYAFSGNLQALGLIGYEVRRFTNRTYPTRSSPVAEGSLMWAPSGLTTVTARGIRTIEDSIGETTTGVTLSQGFLTIDHEYQRNWLLQGRGSVNNAEYGQHVGHETLFGLGAGVSYLFNRNLRLSGAYDFTARSGTTGAVVATPFEEGSSLNSGDYTRHIATLTLRFGL